MPSNIEISYINAIMESVQFEARLDDGVAERLARHLLTNPPFGMTPDQEYETLVHALRLGTEPSESISQRHSAEDFRAFLARLRDHMDAMRPWPELPYRRLNIAEWPSFAQEIPIARLSFGAFAAQNRLRMMFDSVEQHGTEFNVLLLRLRSGTDVALVTPVPGVENVKVRARGSQRRPEEIAAELVEATGFEPSEITLL